MPTRKNDTTPKPSDVEDEDNDSDVFHDASVEKDSIRGVDTPSRSEEGYAIESSSPKSQETVQFPSVLLSESSSHNDQTTPNASSALSPPPLPPNHPPAVPLRENAPSGPPLPPRKRKPFFWTRDRSSTTNSVASTSEILTRSARGTSFSSTANFDLLLSRMDANLESVEKGKISGQPSDGLVDLKSRFEAIRAELEPVQEKKHQELLQRQNHGLTSAESIDLASAEDVEWELWQQVVNDYSTIAKGNPVELSLAIAQGIPQEIRGIIWQIISGSKSLSLEELYTSIVLEDSPHEKAIRRDLSRTSFIKNADPESLYKIIKAYSLFDPEVGYTQGMAFIAVPLLISLEESEAFGMLVKLMKDYGLRDFFLPEMPGLHLRLYQFDRILEDTIPDVHIHLARQGVRSNMYTSQWFLTFFAYKFPLQIVQRIFDVVVAEGIESLLRFAVGLIRRNAATILSLEFDSVLKFLKDNIFDYYVISGSTSADGSPQYRVNDLVADAYDIKILPITLKKYENEYTELHRIEQERVHEVEGLRSANGQLTQRIRRLENTVADLTSEHLAVTNELAHERVKTAKLEDDNEELSARKATLEKQLASLGEGGAEEVSFFFFFHNFNIKVTKFFFF